MAGPFYFIILFLCLVLCSGFPENSLVERALKIHESALTVELVRRGYSEEHIKKIWGGNLMRVFSKVRDAADN